MDRYTTIEMMQKVAEILNKDGMDSHIRVESNGSKSIDIDMGDFILSLSFEALKPNS